MNAHAIEELIDRKLKFTCFYEKEVLDFIDILALKLTQKKKSNKIDFKWEGALKEVLYENMNSVGLQHKIANCNVPCRYKYIFRNTAKAKQNNCL